LFIFIIGSFFNPLSCSISFLDLKLPGWGGAEGPGGGGGPGGGPDGCNTITGTVEFFMKSKFSLRTGE
jgi:hypothetical protein